MKRRFKLSEKDLTRIVKRVIKEDVDQDTMDQLEDLAQDAIDILRAMDDFCEKAKMTYDLELPEDVNTQEEDDLVRNAGYVEMMCSVFEKVLSEYF